MPQSQNFILAGVLYGWSIWVSHISFFTRREHAERLSQLVPILTPDEYCFKRIDIDDPRVVAGLARVETVDHGKRVFVPLLADAGNEAAADKNVVLEPDVSNVLTIDQAGFPILFWK